MHRTEINVLATRTQDVLGEKGRGVRVHYSSVWDHRVDCSSQGNGSASLRGVQGFMQKDGFEGPCARQRLCYKPQGGLVKVLLCCTAVHCGEKDHGL